MNSYLIDTHVAIWLASEPDNLSQLVKKIYLDDKNKLYLSVASIWEMAIKISLKKLVLPISLRDFLNDHILANHMDILHLKPDHCARVSEMPFYHRDPFDRVLVAQALHEKMSLISKDSVFRKYDCELVW